MGLHGVPENGRFVKETSWNGPVTSRLVPPDPDMAPTRQPVGLCFLAGPGWNPVTGPHKELSSYPGCYRVRPDQNRQIGSWIIIDRSDWPDRSASCCLGLLSVSSRVGTSAGPRQRFKNNPGAAVVLWGSSGDTDRWQVNGLAPGSDRLVPKAGLGARAWLRLAIYRARAAKSTRRGAGANPGVQAQAWLGSTQSYLLLRNVLSWLSMHFVPVLLVQPTY